MIGGPIITQLLTHVGWHMTFVILGLVGLVWVGFWAVMYRDRPEDHPRVNTEEREYILLGRRAEEGSAVSQIDWRSLFTNRNLWMSAVGYFAWGYMFWAFMYWLPGYLGQTFHLNLGSVGLFSVLPWALATVGALASGVIVDRIFKRNQNRRPRFIVMGIALLLAGLSLIPIVTAPSLTTALIFISLGVGFGMLTGPLWWVTAIDAEPEQPAIAAGFVDAAFALSGIVAPAVTGLIVQATGSFGSGFAVMAILAIVGAVCLIFVTREPKVGQHDASVRASIQ